MLRYLPICFALLVSICAQHEQFAEHLRWNYFNYTWPSPAEYWNAKRDGSYIEKNNINSGIKVYKDKLYLSIPRYRDGVPVTLAVTSTNVRSQNYGPPLEPYPNWEAQKIGDCSALQNVHNMEIDPKGRMWVIDTGRLNTLTPQPRTNCPPKLVILDLENNGRVLRSYTFPEDVANRSASVLMDIAVDHEHGGLAYISDSDEPGIIVYSLVNNTSWKVRDSSMYGVDDAVGFKVEDMNVGVKVNIYDVTLSPADKEGGKREVFFSPLSSFEVFSVPTWALLKAQFRSPGEDRDRYVGRFVRNVGRRPSQAEGMVMTNAGKMYYGLLPHDSVGMWNSNSTDLTEGQRIIARDHRLLQSPGNFAIDDDGNLWVMSNRMHRYVNDRLDIREPNFRAMKMRLGEKGYEYYGDGRAPELPKIDGRESLIARFG